MLATPSIVHPTSLEEAVGLLAEDSSSQPLGGGTAIQILRKQGLLAPSSLVDLSLIPEMRGVDRHDGTLRIGAMVTHRHVEQSTVIRESVPLLQETYRQVGNVRVRNTATVGGNLALADYRLDPPAALLALDAFVITVGPRGTRSVPVREFFVDLQRTALEPAELIQEIRVPIHDSTWSGAYSKFSSLAVHDWPCVGVAALVQSSHVGRATAARVGVTALASTPFVVSVSAPAGVAEDELADEAAAAVREKIDPIPDVRGSVAYKTRLCATIVRDAVYAACSAKKQARVA
jgi:carbon-monoxide dehydrogenase medium subunit